MTPSFAHRVRRSDRGPAPVPLLVLLHDLGPDEDDLFALEANLAAWCHPGAGHGAAVVLPRLGVKLDFRECDLRREIGESSLRGLAGWLRSRPDESGGP